MAKKKEKHAGGRPPKYKTVEQLQKKIKEYFETCDNEDRPYTVMGLALALNLTRQGLREYANKGEFSDTIKEARGIVERQVEERLFSNCPTGAIFWLKNNAETPYRDKQELEHTGKDGEVLGIGLFTDMEMAARLAYLLSRAKKRKEENAKRSK